jgi:ketosteroid isomerase-like protein
MSGTPDRVAVDAALDAALDAAGTRLARGAAYVCCDLGSLPGDLRALDRLARLGLAAARRHSRLEVRSGDQDLQRLIALAGLEKVLRLAPATQPAARQPERSTGSHIEPVTGHDGGSTVGDTATRGASGSPDEGVGMTQTTTTPEITIQHTEHPNATKLREAFEAFARGDLEHLQRNMTEDATWTNAGTSAIAGTYTGWEQIVGMLGQLFERTGGTFTTSIVSLLANDTQAAAIYDATATVDGQTETMRYFLLDTYAADGRVADTQVVAFDQATADDFMPA